MFSHDMLSGFSVCCFVVGFYKVFVGVGFRMFSTFTTQRNKFKESGFFSLHANGSGEFRMLSI